MRIGTNLESSTAELRVEKVLEFMQTNMAFITTLWIGNGAVLKNSSESQLKEFWKSNNSGHELFIFKFF